MQNFNDIDILLGKETRHSLHPGNKAFRREVNRCEQYYQKEDEEKYLIAQNIVHKFIKRGARFIKKDDDTGMWVEVDIESVYKETQQTHSLDFYTKIMEKSVSFSRQESPEFDIALVNDDLYHLVVTFQGPTDSPYEEGMFQCEFRFPDTFPYMPPKCVMLTKVWHHFFDFETGQVCVDIMLDESWSPALMRIDAIVVSIQSLLTENLQEDSIPLNLKAAKIWKEDKARFDVLASIKTRRYAREDCKERPSGVLLEKKELNNLVEQLHKEVDDSSLLEKLLQLVERVRNKEQYGRVLAAVKKSKEQPSMTKKLVRELELWFEDPDMDRSRRDLLFALDIIQKDLGNGILFDRCVATAKKAHTNGQVQLVDEFLSKILEWPNKTESELTILEEKLGNWWHEEIFEHSPGEEIELFISHRGPDTKETLARPLHNILRSLEIPSFFDQSSIQFGEQNEGEVARGLWSCNSGLVVISENFLGSRWCRRELKTLYHRKQQEDGFMLLLVFASEKLLHDPQLRRLKKIASLVRSSGCSDRHHLITEVLPKLSSSMGFEGSVEQYKERLDEYLNDPKVTAPPSLRRQE